jgi:plastocyanin
MVEPHPVDNRVRQGDRSIGDAMKKILMLLATVCLAAAVAACGSESSYTTTEGDTGTATATSKATSETTATTTSEAPATTSETTSAPAEPAGVTITIANNSFGEPVTVAPGAEVTVKNDDTAEHSVTSDTAGAFDEHIDGGESDTFTAPTEPGEYAFSCTYHPAMKGTLIVK